MSTHRPCIIAAVDLNRRAEAVIRRAARLARLGNLALVVAHVVEYHTGFESDHAPAATPRQLQQALAHSARAWLRDLLWHMNLGDAEIVVTIGRPAPALAQLVAEREPRFLLTGALKWGRISKLARLAHDARVSGARCDVLHVSVATEGLGGRFARWAGQLLVRAH